MTQTTWWSELGLSEPLAAGASANDRARHQARRRVLSSVRPVEFVPSGEQETSRRLSFDDVKRMIAQVEGEHDASVSAEAEERRRLGWERIEAAYAAPDAEDLLTEGGWAGFTRARAIAWCWNLFQYEPRGFVMPNSYVRERAMKELTSGGIPEVFGYPERARELEQRGLTPHEYRRHQEALGKPTFSQADVSYSQASPSPSPSPL